MKKSVKRAILLAAVLLLVIGYAVRYIQINREFPREKVETADISGALEMDGVRYSAAEAHFMTSEEVSSYVDAEKNKKPEDSTENKCLLVSLTLENSTEAQKTSSLVGIQLASGNWSNALSLTTAIHLEGGATSVQLAPGEKKTVLLPYTMNSGMFSKKDWAQVEERPYSLVLSIYPVRRVLTLTN